MKKIQRSLNLFRIRVFPNTLKLEEILSVRELHFCFKVLIIGYVFTRFNFYSKVNYSNIYFAPMYSFN